MSDMMGLTGFFPSGSQAVSLPTKESPRLILMGGTPIERWKESSLYPAYRSSAKLYRFFLRLKAFLGIGAHSLKDPGDWWVGEFVRDIFPKISSLVLLFGTPGPAQKITIQIWFNRDVIGYLKLAQTQAARIRLDREHQMLISLPKGVGPQVLRFGDVMDRKALLITPITGKPLSIGLPPHPLVWRFVQSLQTPVTFSVDSHPWIQRLRLLDKENVDPWVDRLSRYKWPLAYQHGDLAPWNLLSTKDHVVAIDWEYGTAQGFPYVDIIHYYLQISFLIHRVGPHEAKRLITKFLSHRLNRFDPNAIEALVNIGVFSTFKQAEEEGHSKHSPHQTWRQEVWMSDDHAA